MEPDALRGAFPALITPMQAPGVLALPEVGRLVEQAVTDGAAGVLVAGTTGEGSLLPAEARRALTEAASATGVPVIAGASGPSLDALHADVARLADAGASAVLVLAPSFLPLHDQELVDTHLAVAAGADVATIVYHIPQYTGSWLTAEAVAQLAAHDGIIGLKDSSPDSARRAAFIEAAHDRLAVLVGHAASLSDALRAGAHGSITAMANVRLRQIVALHAAVQAADDAAARLQASLTSCESGLAALGVSMPAALKAAVQLEGRIAERWCAPPLRSLAPNRLDGVRTAMLR